MNVIENKISGCFELQPKIFKDKRGLFVKVFHDTLFNELGLCVNFKEEFYSISKKNVLRGMHFQLPPNDHEKLVYCTSGSVIDVVLDLRCSSPTYGEFMQFTLSSEKRNSIYIPKGLAHGYYVTSNDATIVYKASSIHSIESDSGVKWNSFGMAWPSTKIIISDRDQSFETLDSFKSPFLM